MRRYPSKLPRSRPGRPRASRATGSATPRILGGLLHGHCSLAPWAATSRFVGRMWRMLPVQQGMSPTESASPPSLQCKCIAYACGLECRGHSGLMKPAGLRRTVHILETLLMALGEGPRWVRCDLLDQRLLAAAKIALGKAHAHAIPVSLPRWEASPQELLVQVDQSTEQGSSCEGGHSLGRSPG